MLTLAIGDLFVPERALGLPSKFRKLLSPNPSQIPSNSKISEVICLGNITSSMETLQFLHNLSPKLHLVKGEHDNIQILSQQLNSISKEEKQIPLYNVITHDNLKIGFTNGFQIVPKNDPLGLSALARELDVDILIWGGTHKVEAYTLDGKFFINPGSATGAFTFDWPENDEDEEEEEVEETEAESSSLQADNDNDTDNKQPQEEVKESNGTEPQDKPESEHTEIAVVENQEDGPVESASAPENAKKNESTQIDQELLSEIVESNSIIPSFCLLETQGSVCTLYIYTYLNNEVKVDKVTYSKD